MNLMYVHIIVSSLQVYHAFSTYALTFPHGSTNRRHLEKVILGSIWELGWEGRVMGKRKGRIVPYLGWVFLFFIGLKPPNIGELKKSIGIWERILEGFESFSKSFHLFIIITKPLLPPFTNWSRQLAKNVWRHHGCYLITLNILVISTLLPPLPPPLKPSSPLPS